MPFELDHFFVCTSVGAPEAEELVRFGLVEGAPNRHPGQGTANRRFFFAGAFLELLWVDDAAEAQSAAVRRTGLWERWSKRDQGASPFGVCLRSTEQQPGEAPFPTWEYRPPYLPGDLALEMADDSATAGVPLLFYITFGRRPDSDEPARRQPLDHPAGLRAITRLEVGVPTPRALPAAAPLVSSVRFHAAGEHLLTVGFDGEPRGQSRDFRPALPLVFRW